MTLQALRLACLSRLTYVRLQQFCIQAKPRMQHDDSKVSVLPEQSSPRIEANCERHDQKSVDTAVYISSCVTL